MVKGEKKHIFMDMISNGLGYISSIVSASIFPPIAEGTEMVINTIEKRIMDTIEKRMIQLEKRIVRNVSSLLIIGFGSIFLIFSLLFFLIEHFGWTKNASFFSIGIVIFAIGILLKSSESKR